MAGVDLIANLEAAAVPFDRGFRAAAAVAEDAGLAAAAEDAGLEVGAGLAVAVDLAVAEDAGREVADAVRAVVAVFGDAVELRREGEHFVQWGASVLKK